MKLIIWHDIVSFPFLLRGIELPKNGHKEIDRKSI